MSTKALVSKKGCRSIACIWEDVLAEEVDEELVLALVLLVDGGV